MFFWRSPSLRNYQDIFYSYDAKFFPEFAQTLSKVFLFQSNNNKNNNNSNNNTLSMPCDSSVGMFQSEQEAK